MFVLFYDLRDNQTRMVYITPAPTYEEALRAVHANFGFGNVQIISFISAHNNGTIKV